MKTLGLIPARIESQRLPRKPLLPLDGLPMIVHTFKRAQLAKSLELVFVCTDSEEIAATVQEAGGRVIMTRRDHANGTERIAEAARIIDSELGISADLIVDVQGDQPLLDPAHVDAVVQEHMRHPDWDILVPSLPTDDPQTPNVVKIIHDINFRVLAMSRSVIPNPFRSKPKRYLEHLDSISFRPAALQKFASFAPTPIEQAEGIELMRAIESGMVLGTLVLQGTCFSVNVPEDYERARVLMASDPIRHMY